MLRRLRRSSRVTLVLVGVAALGGCGGDDSRRDVYASREDCLADWGNRPEDCTPATEDKHRRHGYFYGPIYTHRSGTGFRSGATDWSTGGSRAGSRAIGSSSSSSGVSRGGFGSSARSSGG